MQIKLPSGSPPKLPVFMPAPAWVGDKTKQKEALAAAGQDDFDYYDIAMLAIGIGLSVGGSEIKKLSGKTVPISAISNLVQSGIDGAKGTEARHEEMMEKLTVDRRNPYFDEKDTALGVKSPLTQAYLTSRRWKKIGANAVQTLGTLTSLAPVPHGVNVPGAVYHGVASCLTLAHMAKIEQIRARYREEQRLQDFCNLVQVAKATKLALRVPQAVGATIPYASLPISITTALLKAGIKLTMVGACYAAASVIHWEAYKEQGYEDFQPLGAADEYELPELPPRAAPLSMAPTRPGATGPRVTFAPPPKKHAPPPVKVIKTGPAGRSAGPASAIFWELLTKRGPTRAFGKYDIQNLVAEPAAWLAIGDKLTLI